MKLLILEIDEPNGIPKFKIGDKVKIEGVGAASVVTEKYDDVLNTWTAKAHFDYVKIIGIVDLK